MKPTFKRKKAGSNTDHEIYVIPLTVQEPFPLEQADVDNICSQHISRQTKICKLKPTTILNGIKL